VSDAYGYLGFSDEDFMSLEADMAQYSADQALHLVSDASAFTSAVDSSERVALTVADGEVLRLRSRMAELELLAVSAPAAALPRREAKTRVPSQGCLSKAASARLKPSCISKAASARLHQQGCISKAAPARL
jgi:hypothetical protein